MTRSNGRFVTFLSGSLAALACLVACARDCPLVSCAPPVVAELSLSAPVHASGQVVACHQDKCATGTLPVSPATVSFSNGDVFDGQLRSAPDGSLQLAVSWIAGGDGDRYTVVVRDASGAQLASFDKTAHFSQGAIDGCPGCVSASLQ